MNGWGIADKMHFVHRHRSALPKESLSIVKRKGLSAQKSSESPIYLVFMLYISDCLRTIFTREHRSVVTMKEMAQVSAFEAAAGSRVQFTVC